MLNDAKRICINAINACLPTSSLRRAMEGINIKGDIYLLAVGKAAYEMAKTVSTLVNIKQGIVISKYGHIDGYLDNITCYEAGHPIVDENSIEATDKAISFLSQLKNDDTLLFLLSGGASALLEKPLIDLKQLQDINDQMLKKALTINEINTIRKKLSAVKGGKLVSYCNGARIISFILSDVLDNDLGIIGSGPTYSDFTSREDAYRIIDKYQLELSDEAKRIIIDSDKTIVENGEYHIVGSIKQLVNQAIFEANRLSYNAIVLDDHYNGNIKKAASFLLGNIKKYLKSDENICLIMGSEITVNVKGDGKGGRNQELVFTLMKEIAKLDNVLLMSLASDGTDGPTDAAGGYVDKYSYSKLIDMGLDYDDILNRNDTYHGLKAIGNLIKIGPTGTNVNDLSVVLISNNK